AATQRRCASPLCLLRASLSLPVVCATVPPPPALYPLSLHDALPILTSSRSSIRRPGWGLRREIAIVRLNALVDGSWGSGSTRNRSEEHTSELQSRENLVCRLLLEKKKQDLPRAPSSITGRRASLRAR